MHSDDPTEHGALAEDWQSESDHGGGRGSGWTGSGGDGEPADWAEASDWGEPSTLVENRMTILWVVLIGAFMILLDATIVNVAVPSIERSLHASFASVEWVVSGYALAYGLLLIPAGRLGDRVGHKKVYAVGLVGFTAASVLCGTSTSAGELVAWRVVQGAMAGVMNPPILAIIQATFPQKERGKAFGYYGAIAGLATALGPLAGGLLIAWNFHGWDWRPVFLVNLPIGVVGLVAALRVIRESRGERQSLDLAGIGLISATMVLITYPLIEGQGAGWPAWTFACMACAVPVLALFVWWERRVSRNGGTPLVKISLFSNRAFAAGSALSLVYFAGFIGLLFVLSMYVQIGLGWSALHAGLTILPFAAGTFFGAAASDQVTRRIGRGVLQIGTVVVALATIAIIAVIHAEGISVSSYDLLPALLIGGIGSGMVIAPNVAVVLAGVPWQEAGSASGVVSTAQRLGQSVGIAVVGVALFVSLANVAPHAARQALPILRQQLAAEQPASTQQRFVTCFDAQVRASDPTAPPPGCSAHDQPARVAAAYQDAGQDALAQAFTHASQVAFLYALGALVLAALLVPLLPRRLRDDEWTS